MVVGSVLWILTPVSPEIPLRVIDVALAAGGTIVTAVGTVPPVGTVMVFAPEERVLISTEAGLEEFAAAERTSEPVTSPVKVIVVARVEAAAIS